MKLRLLAMTSALAILTAQPALAQQTSTTTTPPAPTTPQPMASQSATQAPKLILAISMDQFSGDLFNEYRQHFVGGLKRMANGAVFSSAFQGHAATETCPGHSTLLTGSFPGRTGIIANVWIDWSVAREN